MAGNTDAAGGSVLALRILALVLALISLYNILIPEKIAVGISGLGVAILSGVVLPIALRRTDGE
ncbi:MAG: hypothetical protein ACLFWF_10180 [Alphaproteobacteria bacterium]